MRRREFITLLGGAAAAWPLSAWVQQSERMRRIGMLESLKADDKEAQARISAFAQGLKELGWTEAATFKSTSGLGRTMPPYASTRRKWSRLRRK